LFADEVATPADGFSARGTPRAYLFWLLLAGTVSSNLSAIAIGDTSDLQNRSFFRSIQLELNVL
jgi:hypothetical protein